MARNGTAAKTAKAHILDEFDLQPGEMTKEMVRQRLGCSVRKVEMLKADGKLAAEKKTRRIDGVVKPNQLIFREEDVEKYIHDEANKSTKIPTIESQAMEIVRPTAEIQTQAIAMLGRALGVGPRKDPFLEVDAAAEEYNLSVAGIKGMIKTGALTRYPGKNGRTMISRRQIENL